MRFRRFCVAAEPLENGGGWIKLLFGMSLPSEPSVGWLITPSGVIIIMTLSWGSELTSMRYPGGRKVLQPPISSEVTAEQHRDLVDDAGCVDTAYIAISVRTSECRLTSGP